MSGSGTPRLPPVDASGLVVGVIAARWHDTVARGLLDGAHRALDDCQVSQRVVVRTPGSFELPVAAARLAASGPDALVALGVVIRGGTPHFEYVCQAATVGLTEVSVRTGIPVGFGVLTCDTQEQALDRAGLPGSRQDCGYGAALAAVTTAVTLSSPDLAGPDPAGPFLARD